MTKHRCRDEHERHGCLGEADERYTMDFTDVEPGRYFYWCAFCGPEAHAMSAAIQGLDDKGATKFHAAVDEAYRKMRENAS